MTENVPASRRSWLPLALLASLAINLFLVGLIGGQMLWGKDEDAKRAQASRGYSLHPRVMMEALPEARHEDIRAFWKEARKGMGREWRGINEIRREVDATLRAEPFDPKALGDARQREMDARSALRMKHNGDIAEFLATLSGEERKAVADLAMERLEKQIAYWRERARKRREREGE